MGQTDPFLIRCATLSRRGGPDLFSLPHAPDPTPSPLSLAQSANALTYDELQGLTYLQVKGTGVANTCSVLNGGTSDLKVREGAILWLCGRGELAASNDQLPAVAHAGSRSIERSRQRPRDTHI